jgi:hypothetical protein
VARLLANTFVASGVRILRYSRRAALGRVVGGRAGWLCAGASARAAAAAATAATAAAITAATAAFTALTAFAAYSHCDRGGLLYASHEVVNASGVRDSRGDRLGLALGRRRSP